MKNTNLRVQETHHIPGRINSKIHAYTYHDQTVENQNQIQNFENIKREKTHHVQVFLSKIKS